MSDLDTRNEWSATREVPIISVRDVVVGFGQRRCSTNCRSMS